MVGSELSTDNRPQAVNMAWRGSTVQVSSAPGSLLQHPTPYALDGYHTPYAPHSRNILHLEQKAEEMSSGGSDIAEEIRRMNEESKLRSRQNSIQSSHQEEVDGVRGAARVGGYSSPGHITSPVGSAPSGSWSQASMARKASASGSSRLAQMIEPIQEGRPLDSPLAPSVASYGSPTDQQPSRDASYSSFARRHDQLADDPLEHITSSLPTQSPDGRRGGDGTHVTKDLPGTTTPPPRTHSSNTFQEAELAFKDFDGVHFSPDADDFLELNTLGMESRRVSARNSEY